jgi:branched-chain amino acid transport system substrate-binding protein
MKKLILVMMIIALFLVASCSSTEIVETGGDDYANSNIEKTELGPIKVGLITALSGDLAVLGVPIKQAAELAVKEINAKGGRQITLYTEDGKCTGKDAAAAYQKLKSANNIEVVVGTCSPEVMSVVDSANTDGVLVMSPSATSPDITPLKVTRVAPSDALQGKVGADLVKEKGHTKVAVLYINNDYGVAFKDVFVKEAGDLVLGAESYAPNAKDFRTQLTKLSEADSVFIIGFGHEAKFIIDQMKELGMEVPKYGGEAVKTDDILDNGEGILLTVPSSEGESYDVFAAAYKVEFGEEPKVFSGESYDVIHVIAEAGKNNANLVEGIKSVKSYNGAAGSVTFDENGDVTKPYTIFTVEGGKFVKVE